GIGRAGSGCGHVGRRSDADSGSSGGQRGGGGFPAAVQPRSRGRLPLHPAPCFRGNRASPGQSQRQPDAHGTGLGRGAARANWPSFAPLLAAAAWALGFQGAARKAFVGDGSANNWTLQRRFFASFVPILDFIHALSYVFAAAMAGRKFAAGWAYYQQWIRWVWQGRVAEVIAALEAR